MPMLYGPEQSQGEAELRAGRKCLFYGLPSSRPGHGYLSICGKELPSTACLYPFYSLQDSIQYLLQCESTFSVSPYPELFRSGFFFFFLVPFFPPFCLTLISWGSRRMSPQIKFLSWVVCVAFRLAGHRNNILGLFEILVSRTAATCKRFWFSGCWEELACVWVQAWRTGAERRGHQPSFPYSFFHFLAYSLMNPVCISSFSISSLSPTWRYKFLAFGCWRYPWESLSLCGGEKSWA